jgi:hypothetical protein
MIADRALRVEPAAAGAMHAFSSRSFPLQRLSP